MHDLHHLRDRNLRLSTKIWLFFMLFVCIVFLLMWLFQIIFLEWFYESMKIRDTAKVALHLVEYYEKHSFEDKANEIALQNEMCIELLDKDGKEVWIPADAARAWQKGQSMSKAELEQRKNELLAKLRAKTPALRK